MNQFKHTLALNRALIRQDVPDDLIPIFFQYVGDFKETPDDLINKHCWSRMEYIWQRIPGRDFTMCLVIIVICAINFIFIKSKSN